MDAAAHTSESLFRTSITQSSPINRTRSPRTASSSSTTRTSSFPIIFCTMRHTRHRRLARFVVFETLPNSGSRNERVLALPDSRYAEDSLLTVELWAYENGFQHGLCLGAFLPREIQDADPVGFRFAMCGDALVVLELSNDETNRLHVLTY
ncbi:hypothetical protein B0F90DRAFT_1822121 [Multifurca ochricompacta]|uniref:Uncharacterized protein n=1 Tax=Multifurca ochricompacta TaxID=376703 RepID=A0AAD4LWJ9_9AGAM|nr:hypothetical protein B0F90DRAFT_1822121 [Multifurca ochricompacta]